MKKVQYKIISIIIILHIIIFIVLLFISYNKQKKYIDLDIQKKQNIIHSIVKEQLHIINQQYTNRVNEFLQRDKTQKILLQNNKDAVELMIATLYNNLKAENPFLRALQLVDKNNTSIYRAHKPDMKGDKIGLVRDMIRTVNQNHKSAYGFELGKNNLLYRVVLPVNIGQDYYGVIDLGISHVAFESSIELAIGDVEMLMILDKEYVQIKSMLKNTIKDGYVFSHFSRYFQNIVKDIDISIQKLYQYTNEYGSFVLDTTLFLQDFRGIDIGKLLIEFDITYLEKRFHSQIVNSMITSLIMIVLLIIIINFSFNYFTKKILKKTKKIEQQNNQIIYEFYHDTLTSLNNRNSLLRDIKDKKPKSIVLFDIVDFSKVNDIYGVDIGDKILKEIAEVLKKIFSNSIIYRIGADQFVLSMQNKHTQKEVEKLVSSAIFEIHSHPMIVSVAIYNEFEMNIVLKAGISDSYIDNILESADMALKYAKKSHKSIIFYNDILNIKDKFKNELMMINKVKNAINENAIILYYQPIVKQDKTITYESLMRLNDNGNIMSPYLFLDIVKNTHYYHQLTKIVIDRSFKEFALKNYDFSINLAFSDIENRDTVKYLFQKVQEYDVADRLIIELLESESFQNLQIITEFIKSAKTLGIKIAIDDFGSGYSNFSYLIKLSPDFIKIDGSIVKNIALDNKSFLIAKSITEFAHSLNIKVIAEFIHDEAVYHKAQEIGVDGFQGYYLSEPKSQI